MINHEVLIEEAKRAIPAFAEEYEKMISKDTIDAESGLHTVFSLIFVPMLLEAAKKNDREALSPMISFIERMIAEGDEDVVNVCEITVIEESFEELTRKQIYKILGTETRKSVDYARQFMLETDPKP